MTYVVSDERGRPVASATSKDEAQTFAYRNTSRKRHPAATVEWTGTGKMFVGGRWNGWEVHEVLEVGGR